MNSKAREMQRKDEFPKQLTGTHGQQRQLLDCIPIAISLSPVKDCPTFSRKSLRTNQLDESLSVNAIKL